MSMSGHTILGGIYSVEVSGWDVEELFFVEKASIEWDAEEEKRVRLRRPLRKGAVIFVRLTESTSALRAYPIAYEADLLRYCADGSCEYRLKQVQPRERRAHYGIG